VRLSDASWHWNPCADSRCDHKFNHAQHSGGTATCTARAVCSVCGVSYGALNTSNHNWGDWRRNREPTCTATGEDIRSCTRNCGVAPQTRVVDRRSHIWSGWTVVTPSNCRDQGTERRTCSWNCSDSPQTRHIPVNNNHSWGNWSEFRAATCLVAGEERQSCTRNCGVAPNTRALPRLECTKGTVASVIQPTCAAAGSRIIRCGRDPTHNWGTESIPINPLAHNWNPWQRFLEPTCVAAGNERRNCRNSSGHQESRSIPIDSSNHAFSTTAWASDASNHWRACTRTGCSGRGPLTRHTATPARPGVCSVCGRTGAFPIPNSTGEVCE
jgi:hypothetical protein